MIIKKIRPKTEFSRHVVTLIQGTALAQLVPMLATPVITRLYSSEEIGRYGYIVALTSAFVPILALRYDQALVLSKNKSELFALSNLSLVLLLFNAIVITFLLFLLDSIFFANHYIVYIFGIFFIFIASGLTNILSAYLNFNKGYEKIAQNIAYSSALNSSGNILLGFWGGGSLSMVFSLLFSKLLSLWFLIKPIKEVFHKFKNQLRVRVVAKRYIDLPKFSAPESLLGSMSSQANFIFIGSYDLKYAGAYFIVNRLLGVPVSVFSSSYSKVFYQSFTALDIPARKAFLKNTWMKMFAYTALPFCLILFFIEQSLLLVLGSDWSDTGKIAIILLPFFWINFIANSTSTSHLTLRLQHIALLFTVISITFKTILFIYGISFGIELFTVIQVIVIYDILQILWMNSYAYMKA